MIITLNIQSENIYFKIFEAVNIAFNKLSINTRKAKGRPPKYSDQQIVACMIYGVNNSIFSLRELEYKIRQDIVFQKIIGLKEVPDHSTFSLRAIALEKYVYYGIYAMLIELMNPSTRICAIDGTALRSSLYDSEARYGKGTRLVRYKGSKLHCTACVCDNILPLSFCITSANVYDNQVPELLYELKTYNLFIVLDDAQWFKVSKTLDYNLLTDVNMRKAKSIESFKDESRYKNALFLQSPIGKNLYKNRVKIEQLFSILKGLYNLENPRLYGQKRYERHVKWVLLSYLIDEFNKVNSKIISRKYPWNL